MAKDPTRWWTLPAAEAVQALHSAIDSGLSDREARQRLARDGKNRLGDKPPASYLARLLRQFTDVTVIALLIAALVASLTATLDAEAPRGIGRFRDAIAIGLIVIINAVIGFFQELKAERALNALRDLGAPTANVVRAGVVQRIPAEDVVVGDVVQLGAGDRVPADLRLLTAADIASDESALTGESTAVEKQLDTLPSDTPLAELSNMVFLGTHVVRGRGTGCVVAAGPATELGKIAALLEGVEHPSTPLQERLKRFGFYVVLGCGVIGMAVFGLGFFQQHAPPSVLLLTAVSLAVAVIPEGLPAITTIVLALGVERMAKKHALIRRLPAVESLGAATVICTDKTGTLTQNRMRVRLLWCAGGTYRVVSDDGLEHVAGDASGPNPLRQLLGAAAYALAPEDPTDVALQQLYTDMKQEYELLEPVPALLTLPFDNRRRMASVLVEADGNLIAYGHGAPEALIERSREILLAGGIQELGVEQRRQISALVEELAASGLRVLALARASVPKLADEADLRARAEKDLVFLGLVGLADPPRPEVQAALTTARRAGVDTIMITGDHPATARAIASELGILDEAGGRVITGEDVQSLSMQELRKVMPSVRVVARATAEHKLSLVQALRADGQVVAMTGDGVNDAPAIKAADIGVAMGQHSTDVTREAAGMVIYDGSYSTIVDAIAEGRTTYQNIKRFILFLFTVNLSLVIAVFVASIANLPPILTPTQILWINLITNGLPALALGMEPIHDDPMLRPPRDPHEPILRGIELVPMAAYGALMAAMGISLFLIFEPASLHLARTAAFTVLALAPLFHAFNSRSRRESLWQLGVLSNWRLLGAFAVALGLQAVAVYVPGTRFVFDTEPLTAQMAILLLGVSSLVLLFGELHKLVLRSLDSKRRPFAGLPAAPG